MLELDIPRHWRTRKARYTLTGEECAGCDLKIFPPRDICPGCGDHTKADFSFSGKGQVYSHTTVYEAPAGFEEQAPYTLAMIKLREGPMVTAQLTDLGGQKPQVGMPVETVTRKLKGGGDERGMIIYGYKFRPAVSSSK